MMTVVVLFAHVANTAAVKPHPHSHDQADYLNFLELNFKLVENSDSSTQMFPSNFANLVNTYLKPLRFS